MLGVGRVAEVGGTTYQVSLPSNFLLINRYMKERGASQIVFVSEGDKTVVKVLDKGRVTMVEAAFPKFLPDGVWEMNPENFVPFVMSGRGVLEVIGDKVVYRGGDGNVVKVGVRRASDPIPDLEKRIDATAEAVINTEILKAAARMGREGDYDTFLGFELTPEGLMLGVWNGYREGAVLKIPKEYVHEFRGSGVGYVRRDLLQAVLPLIENEKKVKLRWSNGKPIELVYDVDGSTVKIFVVPVEYKDTLKADWNISSGKQIGVLDIDSYRVLQKVRGGFFANGIYSADLHYYIRYCAKLPLKLEGAWEFYKEEMPRLDLFYTVGQIPRLYFNNENGKLYVEGWRIGYKLGGQFSPPPCPDVAGPPLPPAIVNAMKNAWKTIFKDDGIYVVPEKYDKNEVQIARAKLGLRDSIIEVPRSILANLPGGTWRLGVMPGGKAVVIDAGKEKLIIFA